MSGRQCSERLAQDFRMSSIEARGAADADHWTLDSLEPRTLFATTACSMMVPMTLSQGHAAAFAPARVRESIQAGVISGEAGSAIVVGDRGIFAGYQWAQHRPDKNSTALWLEVYGGATGRWSGTTLPADAVGTVVAIGNSVFIAGRKMSRGEYGVGLDIYDVAAGAWLRGPRSQAAANSAVVAAGNQILFAGGQVWYYARRTWLGVGGSDAVDIYDTRARKWSAARLSEPRFVVAPTVVGDLAIFPGGVVPQFDGAMRDTNVVDVYNAATSHWSTATLSARSAYASTVLGTRAFFTDGQTMDVFDAANGRWSSVQLSARPLLNGLPKMLTAGHRIVISDGRVLRVYNPRTGELTRTTLPAAVDNPAMAAAGDSILINGGDAMSRGRSETSTVIQVYSMTTGRWSVIPLEDSSEDLSRWAVGVSVGGQAVFAGPGGAGYVFTPTGG